MWKWNLVPTENLPLELILLTKSDLRTYYCFCFMTLKSIHDKFVSIYLLALEDDS